VQAIARVCHETRTPLVPRGGGTGYTGGAVPVHGGVVISMELMNRILEIDEGNLLAIVEPNVITGDLQDAVERVGLFYPPDPASLRQSVIGGNVAECAGGPRAFKYGVTKQYVLGLEAVLPTGSVIHTGGKVVKNVVGYDLTHLLVGSEGTLAIITKVILRLDSETAGPSDVAGDVPERRRGRERRLRSDPRASDSGRARAHRWGFAGRRVAFSWRRALAPVGTGALLLIEVDGLAEQVSEEADRVAQACRVAGATEVLRAGQRSRTPGTVARAPGAVTLAAGHFAAEVQPRRRRAEGPGAAVVRACGRDSEPVFAADSVLWSRRVTATSTSTSWCRRRTRLPIARAHEAERVLFEGVVRLEGSISGEHGIGFAKGRVSRSRADG
jgi:glycolate oxidase